ncbi:UNVERIFIED_CONTAM: hypothetical protein RMT77_002886 [Armadillidium vulgare]
MSENNLGENQLSPIETYLQSIEINANTVRDEGVQREVASGTQNDVISAETVRGIVGNLNAQMTELAKKLEAAGPKPCTGFEMNEHECQLANLIPIMEITNTPITTPESVTYKREGKGEVFSLPFESSGIEITTSPVFNMGNPVSVSPLPVTSTRTYITQPMTTNVNVLPRMQTTTTPPPVTTVNQIPLTATQFDILQQQMALLTQSVSLLTILINKVQTPRVVEPKVYHYENDHDLKQFFEHFEEYCSQKYPQAPNQWVRLLEKYLGGKFLKLFVVITKTTSQYTTVKESLLKWFEHEEKRKNENKLRDYHAAQRKPGEDINMFALRLEQLASRAYPDTNMRNHESLRTAFLFNVSYPVQTKLREYLIQNEMGTQQRVPWERLVMLADSYEREFHTSERTYDSSRNFQSETRTPHQNVQTIEDDEQDVIYIDAVTPVKPTWSEMFQRPAPKGNSKTQVQATPRKSNQQRSNTPRTPPRRIKNIPIPERSQDNSSVSRCDYCWKKGHVMADCYKYLDICSFCKTKEHTRSECWRNNENHSTKGSPTKNKTPECPFCKGEHCGMHCTSRNNQGIASIRAQEQLPKFQEQRPLPQREQYQTRTFGATRPSSDPRAITGARPKTKYVKNCNMCGESHEEGKCSEELGNYLTPQ